MERATPRRLLGAIAVIAISLLWELLPSGPRPANLVLGEQHVFVPAITSVVGLLVVFSIGGFVSRRGFVPVALLITALALLFGQYVLYQIALPTGQENTLGTAIGNIPTMISALASAAIGAYLGEWMYYRRHRSTPSSTGTD